ncbi:MAG: EcsC family protein [Isosphaeraceae bacterium]
MKRRCGAIRRIGHCYGFPLDTPPGRKIVLAVLDLANEVTPEKRVEDLRVLDRLFVAERQGREETVEVDVSAIERAVADDVPLEAVPVVGDLSSLVLDYAFVRRVDATARRVFQERWLRARGKVREIPPALQGQRRSSLEGVACVASEVTYGLLPACGDVSGRARGGGPFARRAGRRSGRSDGARPTPGATPRPFLEGMAGAAEPAKRVAEVAPALG